jgi:hypothetical protein
MRPKTSKRSAAGKREVRKNAKILAPLFLRKPSDTRWYKELYSDSPERAKRFAGLLDSPVATKAFRQLYFVDQEKAEQMLDQHSGPKLKKAVLVEWRAFHRRDLMRPIMHLRGK